MYYYFLLNARFNDYNTAYDNSINRELNSYMKGVYFMSITAKELAKILNLSEAAVSMALNDKPGVSTETRKRVLETAHNYAYDFTKIKKPSKSSGIIYLLIYRKHGAVISNNSFFDVLIESINENCSANVYRLYSHHVYEYAAESVTNQLNHLIKSECDGVILLGTEMYKEDFFPFVYLTLPIVVVDTYFNSVKMDCVNINNVQGAQQATHFLIQRRQKMPGYLHSSYSIHNFEERADGYYQALRMAGFAASTAIVHQLPPYMDGAHAEMLAILDNNEPIADSYFADNDLIAAGAMKAFKERGYRIPEDIAIVGFDNVPMCTYLEPNLTTVKVPVKYMGKMAVERLISVINSKQYMPIKIEVNTNLIKRRSV